ncbi:MAG: TonB-dependent receptor [Polyangiaceae bacterium]|nr:TonB-dependent receptor [Polyangiaceae bacterium]
MADARTEARRHFKTGMSLIAKGNYAEGIAELEEANRILPHPNVTFNIARAHAEAGNLEQAIAAYREYLSSDPADREKVERIVKELEGTLATQKAWAAAEKAQQQKTEQKPATEQPGTPTGETPKPGETDKPDVKPDTGKPVGETKPPPGALDKKETDKIVGEARTEDVYQETVITASRGAQSPLDSPNSTTIITRQDIRLSGITRIPELLRRVAGMDVMQITGGDTNVSMRGFNTRLSNKLLVLINGRTVQNDFLGSTFWESLPIDVDQVERIEVVRGPGSALYGANAFAGVVNIITIAPGEGRSGLRAGYGDHNQAYGSLWASARDGDFAYRASAGYTRYPRWTREVGEGRTDIISEGTDQDLGAQNVRIDVRASRRFGETSELQIGGGFARADIDMYGIGPFNDYALRLDNIDVTSAFRSENFNARLYYLRATGHASANSAYVGQSLYETDPVQNSLGAEFEFVGHFAAPQLLQHEVHVGVSYRLKSIEWSYLADELPIEHHVAGFLQDSVRIGKYVTAVLSGRVDYVPYIERVVPSPRGSIVVKPTEQQAIRLSGSTAFRTTTFLESYLDLPIQLTLPGVELVSAAKRYEDPAFKTDPEQIITVEASYLNQQSDYFEFELTGYYNRITNLIVLADARPLTLSNKGEGIGGLNPETGRYTVAFGGWANQCDIYNVVGGELGGRVYPVEGLDVFANYAINFSSQDRPAGCNVPEDERTSRHKVNAGVQVRTKAGVDGEITFHYQSDQVWGEQVATLEGIVYQSFPLPAYTLLNARLGYRFLKDRAEVSATVFNALAGLTGDPPQMHPFGNRVGRRFMGFFSFRL